MLLRDLASILPYHHRTLMVTLLELRRNASLHAFADSGSGTQVPTARLPTDQAHEYSLLWPEIEIASDFSSWPFFLPLTAKSVDNPFLGFHVNDPVPDSWRMTSWYYCQKSMSRLSYRHGGVTSKARGRNKGLLLAKKSIMKEWWRIFFKNCPGPKM